MGLKILVACEESQRVASSFRKRGFEAYSCDIIECSGGHPEWHIQQDVISLINGNCEFETCDGIKHKIEGEWDLIIAHPPCFVAGTMVVTYDGVKPIENIEVGDLVLTHEGRFKKVTQTMRRITNLISHFYVENSGHIECTPNHPFYTKQMKRTYISHNKALDRALGEFEWRSPKDFITKCSPSGTIKEQTFIASVTDDIKEIPEYNGTEIGVNAFKTKKICTLKMDDVNFWYLIGRWLGDGWHCHKEKGRTHGYYGIGICCAKESKEELEQKIKATGLNYYGNESRTTWRFEIDNKELSNFIRQFGEYSYGKKLPGFAMRLPDEQAKALIQGYLDSDGHITKTGIYSYGTVSKELAYGLKYMINKYYKVGVSVKETNNSRASVIEGRQCNVRPIYVSSFRMDERPQTRYIRDEKYIYTPYKKYEEINKEVEVYNLSVEDDESYVVNGIIAHNCTYITIAANKYYDEEKYGDKARERKKKREEACEFFMKFINADCDHIAVENPVGVMNTRYRKPDQIINPYQFGHPVGKKTCLWLKGLPLLQPTNIVEPERIHSKGKTGGYSGPSWLVRDENGKVLPWGDPRTSLARSKTYPGIAEAIAKQWGDYLIRLEENKNESDETSTSITT